MPLIRELTAACDAEGCDITDKVSPTTTQPFVVLADRGWGGDFTEDHEILLYCPRHNGTAGP